MKKGSHQDVLYAIVNIANYSLTAPEPKPKKNRELKTEILPVPTALATPSAPSPALPTPEG